MSEDDDAFDDGDPLDALLAVGFGDGEPFRGDIYADYRARSYDLCEQEKWTRYRQFLENEVAKAELSTAMLGAVRKLKRQEKHAALDAWDRAAVSWKEWDAGEMRRELQPWIDAATAQQELQDGVTAAPPKTLWRKFLAALLGCGD